MSENEELPTAREIIMQAIARPGIDVVLSGYAPLCQRIEQDLAKAGLIISRPTPAVSTTVAEGLVPATRRRLHGDTTHRRF